MDLRWREFGITEDDEQPILSGNRVAYQSLTKQY